MSGRAIPGRFGLPFIGETLALLRDAHGFLRQRVLRYGPVFRTHLFGEPLVVFSGPDALKFFVQSDAFARKGAALPHVQRLLGEVLPIVDDPEHLRRKRTIAGALTGGMLDGAVGVMRPVIERHLSRWMAMGTFTARGEMDALSYELTHELLFGRPPDNLALKEALDAFLGGLTALPLDLPFTAFGRALKGRDAMRAFVSAELAAPAGILGAIANTRGEDGKPFGEALLFEGVHLLFAMYSSISVSLLMTLQFLAQERPLRSRILADMGRVVGAGPLTAEHVRHLPSLEHFTKEIRRYHPFNPMTFFARVVRPVTYGGFTIPVGWRAVGALSASMHIPDIYVQPERFDPDRFDARCPVHADPDAFVAHGAGPMEGHRCGGEMLLTRIMVTMAAVLLHEHDWELPPQDLTPNTDIFPVPRSGLRIRFFRRTDGTAAAPVAAAS